VLFLANFTGWSLAEIGELETDELMAWVNLIPQEK